MATPTVPLYASFGGRFTAIVSGGIDVVVVVVAVIVCGPPEGEKLDGLTTIRVTMTPTAPAIAATPAVKRSGFH